MTNISDKDREAAAAYVEWSQFPFVAKEIRKGAWDEHFTVKAFARHREEARAEGMREAANLCEEFGNSFNPLSAFESGQQVTALDIATALRNAIEGKE